MNAQNADGCVFMCRLCNLFSSSRSQLLAHCSQQHPEQKPLEDIIIALQPLGDHPVEMLPDKEVPLKRKRGRPKGSTKKRHLDLTESTQSVDGDLGREEVKQKEQEEQHQSVENANPREISALGCKNCHRSFSNRRQVLKHICLKEEDEDEEEINHEANRHMLELIETEDFESKQNAAKPGPTKEKRVKFRSPKSSQSCVSNKDGEALPKRTLVDVILTEDESLPAGVSKMIPVEDSPAETSAAQPQEAPGEATTCENDPTTNQECSASSTSTTKDADNKGFKEYSIKQDSDNLLQGQLKIFACEFCYKIFKFRHSLVAHLRTHTQEKPFQCPQCDYASAIKANLNVHLRKHTGEKFSCPHCPFKCLSPGHLKVHIERVHLKMKQHCSFCDKKYSDVKNLLKHIEKQHDLEDPDVSQNYQQLSLKTRRGLRQLLFRCSTCNRRFKNQLERERHMLIHGPQRPFVCLVCDHAATKMTALASHVKKHFFIYLCCSCDEKLVSSQRLKSHLEENHPDLDQKQAFTDSINLSYYLASPEEGEASKGTEFTEKEAIEQHNLGQEGRGDRMEETNVKNPTEDEELHNGTEKQPNEEREEEERGKYQEKTLKEGEEIKKQEEGECSERISNKDTSGEGPEDNTKISSSPKIYSHSLLNDKAQEDTQTSAVSSQSLPLSNSAMKKGLSSDAEVVGGQTPPLQKESQVVYQSAFQQVLSTIQKTTLDMERFYKLRKIYGDLECQYCGKLFWYKVHFNVHVRTHTKEHLHYCSKCNYSSITKSSLKRHQTQKHSDLLLSCSNPGCKYTTPDKYKLQNHVRIQHGQQTSATCPVCHQNYPEHRLNHHIKSSHPDKSPVRSKGLMQRAEKCPYCDSYFLKNSSDFRQHIWAHQGLKPYPCSMCDYTGRSRSNLKTHMNRHNAEKHHLCDLCGKKFKSKLTLKSHSLSHTNEGKRFQCSECNFSTVFKPYLLRHMEQHAKFKPFRCSHCHYSCNIAGALKRHYNMKHPDKMYENAGPGLPDSDTLKKQGGMKCSECEFVYGTKWELNRHMKSKHSLKVVECTMEVAQEIEAPFMSVEDEQQLTETPLAVLEDNATIQLNPTQLNSETQDDVTSVVAMAPGTVTVVQQVAEEQELINYSNELMVVDSEAGLESDQVMVVEDADGLEALTVLTQGENMHHYIVYVQEQTVEIN